MPRTASGFIAWESWAYCSKPNGSKKSRRFALISTLFASKPASIWEIAFTATFWSRLAKAGDSLRPWREAMNWIFLGALGGALSVVLGAFGAHALAARLDARALELWETAARYLMY